jgi:phage FluMu protein gp41
MAKRTRYQNRTTTRPAAKREGSAVVRRPSAADAVLPAELSDDLPPPRSSSSLTADEEARATQLEAEMVAREKAAIAASLRRKARGEATDAWIGDINAPLSVRAAHEYAYVARDVKRIALTATLMASILAALHILVNVMGVISF